MNDYFNVDEVNSAILGLIGTYPTLCTKIDLPNNSVLGKSNLAMRIGEPVSPKSKGVLFTGCTHAREWAGAEICILFAADILQAFHDGTGLVFGGKTYTRNDIRRLLETVDLFVFPCVNPDGRAFSMANDAVNGPNGWRKNRRPVAGGQTGIDLNRNYDFLWDFTVKFDPSAFNLNLASTNPADITYHGTGPATEPETQNVIWLLDTFPQIGFYIDIHNWVVPGDMLFSWGDAPDQSTNPAMNFTNAAFDGLRGVSNAAQYSEFIPPDDLLTAQALAQRTTAAIQAVRGRSYVPKSGFDLYATSGTSDDYSFSRHIADSSKSKVMAYTIEYESTHGSFHPAWTDMEPIVIDVVAGLVEFCLAARNIHKSTYFIRDRSHFSAQEVQPFTSMGSPAVFLEAVYLVLDGYTLSEATAAPIVLDVRWADNSVAVPGMSATAGSPLLEDPSVPTIAQRITIPCDVRFDTSDAFGLLPPSNQRDVILRAQPAAIAAETTITLFHDSKPFMKDGAIPWFSIDERVVSLQPNVGINPSLVLGAAEQPLDFIKRAVDMFNTPAGQTFFDTSLSTDPDDSRLEISSHVGGQPVYNFAFAKVRYQAPAGVDATNVRMFFRLFTTAVTSLNYDEATVYPRIGNGPTAVPQIGLVGGLHASIPFFAAARDGSLLAPLDPVNVRDVHGAGTTESTAFFGCWLDFNQNDTLRNWIRGQHQCLVAELHYPAFPIPPNATPADNDSLAQRNLVIVESDNPGGPAAHTVQHSFLIKPTTHVPLTALARPAKATMAAVERPDELLIRWHGLPKDSVVDIYLPGVDVEAIVEFSESRLGPQVIEQIDPHTLRCRVGDVTYIPIPGDRGPALAGLISIQLPPSVRQGERYRVVAQQVMGDARRIAGAFQFDIPVSRAELLLASEERRLAVLRFIALQLPAADIYHAVFERYTSQIADRVQAFGGSPKDIPPSPAGGPRDQPGADDGTGNLIVSFEDGGGKQSSDTVDVFLAHQTLSDRREVRNWPARKDLLVTGLISTHSGLYSVQVVPRKHETEGQFASVEEGRNVRVRFVLEPRD
jgi:murein tripeptide amidase MpaA